MKVIDEKGNIRNLSYNNFQQKAGIGEGQRMPLEKVIEIVTDKGYIWIEGTKFEGRDIKFEAVCSKCDYHCQISISGLSRKQGIGCEFCYFSNRKKYDWNYIKKIAGENSCKITTKPENFRDRDSVIDFICKCGNSHSTNARQFIKSSQCLNCSKEQRKETNIQIYGSENVLSSEYGKNKIKDFYNKKYGVDHNTKVKEIREKAEQTCLKNYGVSHGFNTQESIEKARATSMEKYGSKCFPTSEEGKKQCRERYGCDYAMQNREIYMKSMKNSHKSKPYKFPSGRVEMIQGYEHVCLDHLLFKEKFSEDDIIAGFLKTPEIKYFHNDAHHNYYMDFYIPSIDLGIEVKSAFTYNNHRAVNRLKIEAAKKKCKEFRVYIYIERKSKIEPYFVIYYINGNIDKYELDPNFFPSDIDLFDELCVKLNNVDIIIEEGDD